MLKQGLFDIKENIKLNKSMYKMVLAGDASAISAPGQFVNIKLDGFFLRRPISVCDYSENDFTILYKVVGAGTEKMSEMKEGKLDILTGLGNGFDTSKSGQFPVLIGGGAGVPPMYNLAKVLKDQGKTPTVIMGFNTKDEIYYLDEFNAVCDTIVTTADGSFGTKGFVTAALENLNYTYTYSCGPEPMLKAIYDVSKTDGEFSFEERMGCGFGACMGCSCKTKYGNKRICKEGPVLCKEEIIW
ncbi:MAG: dihydroorotate dehydrogenase electron transfer subunit [Clostridia bacterium]|nr:dihydroorotate dehydrogenase electron transfer subunit [Clostridia bacterium]